jgi:hypothetical protein
VALFEQGGIRIPRRRNGVGEVVALAGPGLLLARSAFHEDSLGQPGDRGSCSACSGGKARRGRRRSAGKSWEKKRLFPGSGGSAPRSRALVQRTDAGGTALPGGRDTQCAGLQRRGSRERWRGGGSATRRSRTWPGRRRRRFSSTGRARLGVACQALATASGSEAMRHAPHPATSPAAPRGWPQVGAAGLRVIKL